MEESKLKIALDNLAKRGGIHEPKSLKRKLRKWTRKNTQKIDLAEMVRRGAS